jgi:hypothetical protein
MNAYKFLAPGRRAIFSGIMWPEHAWVEAAGPTAVCRSGVHACLPRHLAYWLLAELWAIELDGDVVETPLKVVAPRGRLRERVEAWDDGARRDFAAECVRRTAGYAAAELREVGLAADAERLETTDALQAAADVARAAADEARERDAADLAAYVCDAVDYAEGGHVGGPALIAARAAVLHAPAGVDDPFAAEREAQGLWLARRLELTDGA